MLSEETFEDRTICPKCQKPGAIALVQTHRDRAKTYSVTCMTELCRWYQVNWLVDVNPDGSVPPVRPHQKAYKPIPDMTERVQAAADAEIRRSMGQ